MTEITSRLSSALAGRYRIERELGEGGMGTVFLAHDLKHDRPVAIKLLKSDNPWAKEPQRFLREIRLAAQLNHPHILGLIDSGADDDLLYYIMPFVDGPTLRQCLEEHKQIPLRTAVAMLRNVAAALAHAHARSIVHRDIKPENVLLTGEHAVVADFGIAKDLAAHTAEHGTTSAGVALGTPGYMAPEQVAADPVIDQRADIYAWGALAYETLTGSVLFPGKSPAATLAAQVVELPSSPLSLRPDLPAVLDALVMRCLAKDPNARPQSMEEVLETLDAVDVRETKVGMRRARITVGVVSAIAVVAALTIAVVRTRDTGSMLRTPSSLVVLPFDLIGGDSTEAHFAYGMFEALITGLTRVPSLRVSSPSAGSTANRDPRELARAFDVDAVLSGSLQRRGSRVRVTARLTDAADGSILWTDQIEREWTDFFALQDEVSQAIVDALRIPLTGTEVRAAARTLPVDTVAYNLYLRGRLYLSRRTAASLRAAQEQFERSIARDSTFALAWAGLGDMWLLRPAYDATPPLEAYPQARSAARRAVDLDSTLAEPHAALGLLAALHDDDWSAARHEFSRAIALQPGYATAHHWRGIMLALQGHADSALAAFEYAATLDPVSLVIASQTSLMYVLARQYDEAVRQGHRAIALDSAFARAHYELAWAEALHGEYGAAERSFAHAGALIGDSLDLERVYLDAVRGNTDAAKQRLRALAGCCIDPAAVGRFGFEYGAAIVAAWAYGAVGEIDDAFDVLAAAQRHRVNPGFVALDPRFDPLREDPRFARLVER